MLAKSKLPSLTILAFHTNLNWSEIKSHSNQPPAINSLICKSTQVILLHKQLMKIDSLICSEDML